MSEVYTLRKKCMNCNRSLKRQSNKSISNKRLTRVITVPDLQKLINEEDPQYNEKLQQANNGSDQSRQETDEWHLTEDSATDSEGENLLETEEQPNLDNIQEYLNLLQIEDEQEPQEMANVDLLLTSTE